jgi:hypothetical protein
MGQTGTPTPAPTREQILDRLACHESMHQSGTVGAGSGAAVPHAALGEPFDLNSWQDLVRVHGAGLGLPVGSD